MTNHQHHHHHRNDNNDNNGSKVWTKTNNHHVDIDPKTPITNNRYGWVPDLPDARDHKYSAPLPYLKKLPSSVDLRDKCPSIYNQADLGSCTANAIAGAVEFDLKKQELPDFMPSRLFIYYNERDMEGTISSDSGAMIRDGIKSINTLGVCTENTWAYNIPRFTEKPPQQAYQEALGNIALQYQRVPRDLKQMKSILVSGYPFVIGFSVYTFFESEEMMSKGILNIPDTNTETLLGGHAVLVVGYDDSKKRFIVRNSWGPDWALQGYFEMPYEYLLNADLSDDFWYIKTVK